MTNQMSEQITKESGPVVEGATGNPEVPGSNPAEPEQFATEQPKMPELRYHDNTPVSKPAAKRPLVEMSPLNESDVSDNIKSYFDESIKAAFKKAIPEIAAQLKSELHELISTEVKKAMGIMKSEIVQEFQAEYDFLSLQSDVKAKCEAEQLESYNRRDNIKIFNVMEKTQQLSTGQIKGESANETIEKVLEISKEINAEVSEVDISIAHRLPGRGATKPIIVKFARRVAKINIMRQKRQLRNDNSNVRIVEDITKARSNFIRMMRSNETITSVWTKENAIFYTKVNDNNRYRFNNLYDGAKDLGYSHEDLLYCFR